MKKLLLLLLAPLAFGCNNVEKATQIAIIPKPVELSIPASASDFTIGGEVITVLNATDNETLKNAAEYYAETLNKKFAKGAKVITQGNAAITLTLNNDIKKEGYSLNISEKGVEIEVSDYNGAAFALQSILQLLPAKVYGNEKQGAMALPAVKINDYPRFGWRGMHLDCSRHFFAIDSVYRYVDYLAMNKMNRFHWHLTDDQGWRMESKVYPLLNEKSAWRVDRTATTWDSRTPIDRKNGEEALYGGYYTQEEIKALCAYAKERGVMVIPEIEMPGHTSEVFAAYPELSCLGTAQEVTPGGYYPETMPTCFCAGNEDVFTFLENILTETIELFPDAQYIHIGGDEVDMQFWSNCEKCQARMKEEGLKDVHELQSYFIKRIERLLNSKGKPMIGWDEILMGGLAPNATVMSWQGIAGGIAAARAGHDVIMTPNSHLYFDYYQNTPEVEPRALGGLITTKRVYSYEPIPDALTPQEGEHILGVQANLWSEHVLHFSHAEYMTLPRMMAVAEVGWTPCEMKDFNDFSKRLSINAQRLSAMGANYHKGSTIVDYETSYDAENKKFNVAFVSEIYGAEIFYTTDGSEPTVNSTLYTEPIVIDKTTDIKAIITLDGEVLSKVPSQRTIGFHKAVGKTLTYGHRYSDGFPGSGESTLIDGFTGSDRHNDGFSQGFNSKDFDVTIDLGEVTEVNQVVASFMQSVGTWIYLPKEVQIAVSEDGKNFTEAGSATHPYSSNDQVVRHKFEINTPQGTKARYVHVKGVNPPTAAGLPGGGYVNWLFADEIFVL
ncbi:MAG: family 20 glycosylhydrolase [Rikenellaceae bacterium]